MKANLTNIFAAGAVASLALLAACGGSSDDGAGQLSEFQVSPEEVKWETPSTTCDLLKTGEYSVIGGTPPYTAYSPYHQLVTFGPAGGTAPTHMGTYVIPNRNGQFAIYVEGCFDPAVVTVLDDLKRVTTIKVSYIASGAT